MTTNAKAMVLASFAADSLALGAHWIYDTDVIQKNFGRMDQLSAPLTDSYHAGKNKGDFTHYGDQALVLLESIGKTGEFSINEFSRSWRQLFDDYNGYVDKASQLTIENLDNNLPPHSCGSLSSDLGGPARMAPLAFLFQDNLAHLLEAVRVQTLLTHNNSANLAGAEFIAKAVFKVLHGAKPVEAMEKALDEGVNDLDLDLRIRSSLDEGDKDNLAVIKHYGQMCAIAAALPGALYLIGRYENDLQSALIENVMAGGDSSARGMVIGMMLGAHLGIDAIPQRWLDEMKATQKITRLLEQIPPA